MKKLFLIILTILPFLAFSQAIPGCGTFTSHAPITAVSNTTYSDYVIDLGGAATVGITIPANAHDIHITRCIIKNGTTANGLIKINSGAFNITIDTCFFQSGWRGINAVGAGNNIHIWYNFFYNIIDPNVTATSSDGGGSSVQLNNCNGSSIQVLDNKSFHDVSSSGIGDQWSVYQSNGTSASPIRVCRNQALNGSTNPPGTGYVGAVGGDVGGSFQRLDSNIYVNVGSVGCQVQGGHDIEMSYNTVYLAQTSYTSVGIAFGNYYRIAGVLQPCYNITMAYNNVKCTNASGQISNWWFDPNTAFQPTGWGTNTYGSSLTASILPNPLWPACSPVVSPPVISYSPTSYAFTQGTPITAIVPTSTGGAVVNYTVSPTLPLGLGLNATSGIISGTPTTVTASATYTVVAHNSAGTSSVPLTLSVKAPVINAPVISYSPNSQTGTVGTAITPMVASNTGGAVATWGISPSLPSGLTFNNGTISGTPLVSSVSTSYTVSATNTGGTGNATVTIQINSIPVVIPHITYPASSYVYNQNQGITPIVPTNTGGIGTYSISSGTLPAGLILNTTTGTISGTPVTATVSPLVVVVSCTNTSGHSDFTLNFAVNTVPSYQFVIIDNRILIR